MIRASILLLCGLFAGFHRASAAEELVVMTFNSWHQWGQITDGFEKAESAIRECGADVVGLQESSPEVAERMAAKLGWRHAVGGSGSVQILSRHPIVKVHVGKSIGSDRLLGACIRWGERPDDEVMLFNIHLDYQRYGPYAAREKGATVEGVLAENARSLRLKQSAAILDEISEALDEADARPVFLTGDFNVPSFLDWTEATKSRHHGLVVEWPETALFAKAGLRDSYRVAHPDPDVSPGTTWSAIHKRGEPQDRIDFILFKGRSARVMESTVFTTLVETTTGPWGGDVKEVAGNTWPSDHAAVVTRFSLNGRDNEGD